MQNSVGYVGMVTDLTILGQQTTTTQVTPIHPCFQLTKAATQDEVIDRLAGRELIRGGSKNQQE
jgi:hypothetical protein